MKLASVRIVTKNVAELAAFYEKVTGIAPSRGPKEEFREDFVELISEGTTLAISSERSSNKFQLEASKSASNRSVVIEFMVEDLDRERERLNDIVSDWVLEPTNQPWGNRSMLFRDLDGNLINLFTAIAKRN